MSCETVAVIVASPKLELLVEWVFECDANELEKLHEADWVKASGDGLRVDDGIVRDRLCDNVTVRAVPEISDVAETVREGIVRDWLGDSVTVRTVSEASAVSDLVDDGVSDLFENVVALCDR